MGWFSSNPPQDLTRRSAYGDIRTSGIGSSVAPTGLHDPRAKDLPRQRTIRRGRAGHPSSMHQNLRAS